MLDIAKFDDINYLEINNNEGEEMLNLFYNCYSGTVIDKYNIRKSIVALVQFEDYSFGVIDSESISKNSTIIYGVKLDGTFYETSIKALLPFEVMERNKIVNGVSIMKHNISCRSIGKIGIKRIFTEDGYSEF